MDLNFEFYIITSKNTIRLPVNPKSYDILETKQIETMRATSFGDVNIAGAHAPITITIDGFFTTHNYEFAKPHTVPISTTFDYVKLIKEIKDHGEIIRLVIADDKSTKINKQFLISDLKYFEDNESNGDINYSITFKEFREMRVSKVSAVGVNPRPSGKPQAPKTYTVISGDNLWNIARKYYGKPDWEKIYNANIAVIGKNPNMIYPGQVFKIP